MLYSTQLTKQKKELKVSFFKENFHLYFYYSNLLIFGFHCLIQYLNFYNSAFQYSKELFLQMSFTAQRPWETFSSCTDYSESEMTMEDVWTWVILAPRSQMRRLPFIKSIYYAWKLKFGH